MVPKKPVNRNRAADLDRPVSPNRALGGDEPCNANRDDTTEEPVTPDRAVKTEKPGVVKRASAAKKPVEANRAISAEEPVTEDRAATEKKPRVSNRAAAVKKPKIIDRAVRTKKPALSDRAVALDKRVALDRTEPLSGAAIQAAMERPHLYTVALSFQTIQKARVAMDLSCKSRPENAPVHLVEKMVLLERSIVKYMEYEAEQYAVWPWLRGIRGIGPRIGGMLLGLIDIRKARTVSSLWRYAGMAAIPWCLNCKIHVQPIAHNPNPLVCPECGSIELIKRAERRVKGHKLHYNDRLKKTCFLIARQFLMAKSEPYVSIYHEMKALYTERHPDWTPGRIDLTARRKMVKAFLVHLWVEWREAEGLPVRQPVTYGEEYLGSAPFVSSKGTSV